MRYFHKLAEGIVVGPLMHVIARKSHLWNEDAVRTTFEGTPHGDVDDILLRFGSPDGDDLEAVDRDAMQELPGAKPMALNIMAMVGGSRLGRVVVTKLAPGRSILPHADTQGKYASYYTRYHAALLGLPGSLFTCGDETVTMLTGELWWFDASAEHALRNNSRDDRVHMLVDVRIDP